MPATPGSFRLNQNPLGAYHLPQAPTSVALARYRGRFRKLRRRCAFVGLRRFPHIFILPRGILSSM